MADIIEFPKRESAVLEPQPDGRFRIRLDVVLDAEKAYELIFTLGFLDRELTQGSVSVFRQPLS